MRGACHRYRAVRGHPTLAFGRPMSARHWLQASNPQNAGSGISCSRICRRSRLGRPVVAAAAAGDDSDEGSEVGSCQITHRRCTGQRSGLTARSRCDVAVAVAGAAAVRAELAPIVAADGVRAGDEVRAALQIRLPDGLPRQFQQAPRRSLIPTLLTVDPPAGVTVTEFVLPEADRPEATGREQPLSVFEHEFTIGVAMTVAAGTAPGDVASPGQPALPGLRRERCATSRRPRTRLDGAGRGQPARAVTPQHADVFGPIAFGARRSAEAAAPGARPRHPSRRRRGCAEPADLSGRPRWRASRSLPCSARPAAISDCATSCSSSTNAESACRNAGCSKAADRWRSCCSSSSAGSRST